MVDVLPSWATERTDAVADAVTDATESFCGFLDKKSQQKLFGKHKWNRRWFVIEESCILYYKSKTDAPDKAIRGMIPLEHVRSVEILHDKVDGRFDVSVVDPTEATVDTSYGGDEDNDYDDEIDVLEAQPKTYQLCAKSEAEAGE